MSEIFLSPLLAYLFLNETLAARQIFGAVVVAMGIASLFIPGSRPPVGGRPFTNSSG
jgi:drug/metabolite transporter (DMT)-like permease